MNVLALTYFDRMGSSSRVRFQQYVPFLKKHEIKVKLSALLPDEYLRIKYKTGKNSFPLVFKCYLKRVNELLRCPEFDLIWIEKELFKLFPATFERILSFKKIPYVVDYDDATFHAYDLNKNPLIKLFLRKKIEIVMRNSNCVIAGNKYIADKAGEYGAQRVEILPSVINLQKYPLEKQPNNKIFTIGWIGSPSTTKYLVTITKALSFILKKDAKFVVVGGTKLNIGNFPITVKKWTEKTEFLDINSFDVGIMPLTDGPWERGKCGFKLIQYMACRKPVIASPVGANKNIVKHGYNGFLAKTIPDWVSSFEKIKRNKNLSALMGVRGRSLVEEEYSVQANVKKLAKILKESLNAT